MPTEWTRPGDPIPRYVPCASCGVMTIGSTSWWGRTPEGREHLRAQGITVRRGEMCRPCHYQATRDQRAEPPAERQVSADELLEEWALLADPNLSVAENCRRLAPRLGMRWRSMERALKRAQASGRAA